MAQILNETVITMSMTLALKNAEVDVTFKLIVDNDPAFAIHDTEVRFETYGPLFRDDFDGGVAAVIDFAIETQLRDSGELDKILDEMEFDSLEESFEQ